MYLTRLLASRELPSQERVLCLLFSFPSSLLRELLHQLMDFDD